MKTSQIEILERVVKHHGPTKQIHKAIQELAELTVELSKYLEGRKNKLEVLAELADADIMVDQLRFIFGYEDAFVARAQKMERLEERLTKWELEKEND